MLIPECGRIVNGAWTVPGGVGLIAELQVAGGDAAFELVGHELAEGG